MNISAWQQISSLYNTAAIGSASTASRSGYSDYTFEELLQSVGASDSLSLSAQGMTLSMLPPPEKADLESMSDEEFSSFLEEMKARTGSIPGVDEDTEVSELTSEQLASLREGLSAMEQNRGNRPPPPDSSQGIPAEISALASTSFTDSASESQWTAMLQSRRMSKAISAYELSNYYAV